MQYTHIIEDWNGACLELQSSNIDLLWCYFSKQTIKRNETKRNNKQTPIDRSIDPHPTKPQQLLFGSFCYQRNATQHNA